MWTQNLACGRNGFFPINVEVEVQDKKYKYKTRSRSTRQKVQVQDKLSKMAHFPQVQDLVTILCAGLQQKGPSGSKVILPDGRADSRFRELDNILGFGNITKRKFFPFTAVDYHFCRQYILASM